MVAGAAAVDDIVGVDVDDDDDDEEADVVDDEDDDDDDDEEEEEEDVDVLLDLSEVGGERGLVGAVSDDDDDVFALLDDNWGTALCGIDGLTTGEGVVVLADEPTVDEVDALVDVDAVDVDAVALFAIAEPDEATAKGGRRRMTTEVHAQKQNKKCRQTLGHTR